MTEKQPPHVEQALAEMAGAENEDQKRAARKRLEAVGYREAAHARKAAAEDSDEPKADRATPQGRRAPSKQQG